MRSMTGFGRGTQCNESWEVTVDLKSVNHRFLDLAIRLPREQIFLDDVLRKTISTSLTRGHIDVFLKIASLNSNCMMQVNEALAKAYYDAGLKISALTGCTMDVTAAAILRMEGVCIQELSDTDAEMLKTLTRQATLDALRNMLEMCRVEGQAMQQDLELHLKQAEEIRNQIQRMAPSVVMNYQSRLEARLSTIQVEALDPSRLAQEVAFMADKCAIDEELARLESHFVQMRAMLQSEGECGKKMDFLIQEMNREANTIGSKASDADITKLVVALKSEIEKMREQIQNVE